MPRFIKINYTPVKHQREFHSDRQSKFLHLSSGFAGGKTFSLVMKAIDLHQINKPFDIGLFAPTIADYKKDVLPTIIEILESNHIPYEYHQTDKWFKFPWSKGKIQVFSCENKIRGPNLAAATINEVTLISFERYKEIIGRVRIKGAKCPQIASSGTPEGISHWAYEFFVENPDENKRIIYGSTRANSENLDPNYIKTLEQTYDKVMIDAYLEGMFVNMNSHRFYYAYNQNEHDDITIERIHGADVYVSLDFNVAPMCATLWHYLPVKDEDGINKRNEYGQPLMQLLAFDQIKILDGAETKQMSQAMYQRDLSPDSTIIFPDPAGKQRSTQGKPDIEILKSLGWHQIRVKNVAPRFRARQLNTNNLLSKGLVKLHPKNCEGLKKDLLAVEQDTATFEKIKSNDQLTHFSDGFDYMADILFPLSGRKPESRVTKYR